MKRSELDAIVRGIVPVVAKAVNDIATRMAATEARMQMLGDLRDRVVTMETKAAQPPDMGDVRDRVIALEARATGPNADALRVAIGIAPLQERVAVLEARIQMPKTPNADEVAPDEMAASVAGLLRKELMDLETARPSKARRRIEKDATGYTITDDIVSP